MNEDSFKVTLGFKSYVSKPEVTALDPRFIVKGSQNVLIDYAQRVISRNGYTLFGAATNGGSGIKGSFEWSTSTGRQFPIRNYDGRYEFYWNSAWNLLKSGFASSTFQYEKLWDNTEKIDVLMGVVGDTNCYKWSGGVTKLWKSTSTTVTKQGVLTGQTTIAFVAGTAGTIAAKITDSALNFLNAGFAAGDTLYVTGSVANSRNFTIASVTAGTITFIMSDTLTTEVVGQTITVHNGEPTWATSRFLTAGTRKIIYQGIEYAYTGGEATDTLTGLTAFPTVAVGDTTWQALITLANPGSISTGFKQDLIGVQLNQLILASTKSQDVYGSSATDYTNFTLTSPRAPGDPFKVTMDNHATCIIPINNPDAKAASTVFGGGTSEFFQLSFTMSQDNLNEIVRMVKLETAISSGLISKDAIASVKKMIMYISREPALDSIGNVQAQDSTDVPFSDPIKNDFDSYNFTNAHMKYWKRALYIALPVHGLVLIYDFMRKLWQPPQTIPVSRLAIIDDWLYGHSSVSNETYKLFTGATDNGAVIHQVARFAYNNGGRRDRLKNMSEQWTDGYISPNGTLKYNVYFGFEGELGIKSFMISGSDSAVVAQLSGTPLGSEPMGNVPLGGSQFAPITGLIGATSPLLRFWQADTTDAVDYTEQFVEYVMDTLGGQFAIVAYGNNQWDSGTSPVSHKK